MDEADKLYFYKGPGGHMHITDEYIDTYLVPFLRGDTPAPSMYPRTINGAILN